MQAGAFGTGTESDSSTDQAWTQQDLVVPGAAPSGLQHQKIAESLQQQQQQQQLFQHQQQQQQQELQLASDTQRANAGFAPIGLATPVAGQDIGRALYGSFPAQDVSQLATMQVGATGRGTEFGPSFAQPGVQQDLGVPSEAQNGLQLQRLIYGQQQQQLFQYQQLQQQQGLQALEASLFVGSQQHQQQPQQSLAPLATIEGASGANNIVNSQDNLAQVQQAQLGAWGDTGFSPLRNNIAQDRQVLATSLNEGAGSLGAASLINNFLPEAGLNLAIATRPMASDSMEANQLAWQQANSLAAEQSYLLGSKILPADLNFQTPEQHQQKLSLIQQQQQQQDQQQLFMNQQIMALGQQQQQQQQQGQSVSLPQQQQQGVVYPIAIDPRVELVEQADVPKPSKLDQQEALAFEPLNHLPNELLHPNEQIGPNFSLEQQDLPQEFANQAQFQPLTNFGSPVSSLQPATGQLPNGRLDGGLFDATGVTPLEPAADQTVIQPEAMREVEISPDHLAELGQVGPMAQHPIEPMMQPTDLLPPGVQYDVVSRQTVPVQVGPDDNNVAYSGEPSDVLKRGLETWASISPISDLNQTQSVTGERPIVVDSMSYETDALVDANGEPRIISRVESVPRIERKIMYPRDLIRAQMAV